MNFEYCLLLLLALAVSSIESSEENNDLIVELSNGELRGKDNGKYYSYESIPYAKAPVGELRFEPPVPYTTKWRDVFDATNSLGKCLQWNQLFKGGENKLEGSEDCLYLSVYKPKSGKEKYPVVAFLHGGAFMFGFPQEMGEGHLMANDIMLVKISYRLGPLGFLSTEDDVITGNFGLKDQLLALKWIKENIAQFGGDPENISLLGFSAGGASAHLQMLNPSLQHIAKAVISFSGVAFNPWVIIKNPYKRALKLAQHLNCPCVRNTQAIKHCLQQKDADDIVSSVREFLTFGYNPFTTFGPVVEHKYAEQAFLTEHPKDIIESGSYAHLPLLASYTAQDGGFNAGELLQINPQTGKPFIEDFNDKWLELAPQNLFLENIHTEPFKYAQQLRDQYMGNLTFSEENYMKVQDMYTDVLFKNGVHEALRLHGKSNKAPVYGYIYDNPADSGAANGLSRRQDIHFGTVHGDDFSLFNFPSRSSRPDEKIIAEKLRKMLVDFITKRELSFGDCKLVDNKGNTNRLDMLLITKDKCENIVQ